MSQSQPADETARAMALGPLRCDHLMIHDPVTNEPVKCRRCGKTQWQIEEEEQR